MTTSSDNIIVTDGGQHGAATHVSVETTNSPLFTNHGDIINRHGAIHARAGVTFHVGLAIARCRMMYKLHQKQVRSRGSSEGRVRPGLNLLKGPKILRINTEGTVNDDENVRLQDGNGNQSRIGPVTPDGYGGTGTANEGGDILVDDGQNIEFVDIDNELDEVDNEIVSRGSAVDGSQRHLDDESVDQFSPINIQ